MSHADVRSELRGLDVQAASRSRSSTVLLKVPLTVIKGAHLPRLEPPRDAVEVECVVAYPPCHRALLRRRRALVCLALDTQVHDVVSADRAVVHHNVWRVRGAQRRAMSTREGGALQRAVMAVDDGVEEQKEQGRDRVTRAECIQQSSQMKRQHAARDDPARHATRSTRPPYTHASKPSPAW